MIWIWRFVDGVMFFFACLILMEAFEWGKWYVRRRRRPPT